MKNKSNELSKQGDVMEKFTKYIRIIFIVALILIPIFLLNMIFGVFTDFVTAVNVNSSNEEDIIDLLNKNNITLNGKMELIGLRQFLGDWDLYIRYEDGNTDFKVLNGRWRE